MRDGWLDAESYRRVLRRWTRHAAHYSDGRLALEAWATFRSRAFRRAWAERQAAVYRLSPAQYEELLRDQLAAAARSFEFAVTVQAHEWSWRDLDDDDAVWHLALQVGAAVPVRPSGIEELDEPKPAIEEFFPQATAFSTTYHVRFDTPAASSEADQDVVLRFFGPLGQVALRWEARALLHEGE